MQSYMQSYMHAVLHDSVNQLVSHWSQVKYNNHTKDEDSAEKGVDFRLFTDRDCTLEGDYSPGGCVRFAPGQTVAILSVEILPDRLVEGDEVFHLRIIYVRDGRRSNNLQQSILKVTILDATQRKNMFNHYRLS